MKKVICVFVALAMLAALPQANASIVVNGGFDSYAGALSDGFYQHIPNGTAQGGSAALPGWGVGFSTIATEGNSGVDLVRTDSAPSDFTPAANGNQYVDLNGTPGPGNIYQVLTTVPGQLYSLRFASASTIDSAGLYGVWDGGFFDDLGDAGTPLVALAAMAASSSGDPLDWQYTETSFVAQSTETIIGFGQFAPPSGNQGIFVDDVSVNVIPEPGTIFVWSLLGLTATGLSCNRRRRSA